MATKKKTAKRKTATRTRAATAAGKRATGSKKTARARMQPEGLSLSSAAPSFTVNDIAKSLAWYRDVLGLVPGDRWENEGKLMGVEMKAGRLTFMLGQDDWKKGRDRAKGEGFRLYCETTQDVDRLAGRIKARGGMLAQEPRDEPWGARAFSIDDPDGFLLTVFKQQRRAR
jgi:uncharacterized glyoxalase superfamily protein PhnB